MNVFAINASPKKERGNTALILNPFLGGLKNAGARVELVNAADLDIKSCCGGHTCMFITPGKCMHDDDMAEVAAKMKNADLWVFATPVHSGGVSARLKGILDRLGPLVDPFYEIRAGRSARKPRVGVKGGQVVLVSTCGMWERDNFDPLIAHLKTYAERSVNRKFAGALVRPHGIWMGPLLERGAALDDVFEAARQAGRQLVETGEMSPATLDVVGR